jgi:hypothetical protein
MPSRTFTNPVLGQKSLKSIGFKGWQIINLPGVRTHLRLALGVTVCNKEFINVSHLIQYALFVLPFVNLLTTICHAISNSCYDGISLVEMTLNFDL